MVKSSPKRCPAGKILNPVSGKCVLRTGKIGLAILGKGSPKRKKSSVKQASKSRKSKKSSKKKSSVKRSSKKSSKKNSKSSGRKGPEDSATNYKEGKRKKGLNNEWWVVSVNKNGTHRWVRHVKAASKPRKSSAKKSSKKSSVKRSSKKASKKSSVKRSSKKASKTKASKKSSKRKSSFKKMASKKSSPKRTAGRKAPIEKANSFEEGTHLEGSDGWYIVTMRKDGTLYWKKLPSKPLKKLAITAVKVLKKYYEGNEEVLEIIEGNDFEDYIYTHLINFKDEVVSPQDEYDLLIEGLDEVLIKYGVQKPPGIDRKVIDHVLGVHVLGQ